MTPSDYCGFVIVRLAEGVVADSPAGSVSVTVTALPSAYGSFHADGRALSVFFPDGKSPAAHRFAFNDEVPPPVFWGASRAANVVVEALVQMGARRAARTHRRRRCAWSSQGQDRTGEGYGDTGQ